MSEAVPERGEAGTRDLLPRTWHAFFARFGRLREVQRQAVPKLVRGGDLLVVAPTASGKTEAVVAPLIERCLVGGRLGLGLAIVVVSPTRALCNDLVRRLRGPLNALGLTLDLKTGDAPSLSFDRPPNLLVTTPESLDSLLCRHPRMLRDLRAVVLDEVHLLDGTARGDQARCLLARLERVVARPLQRCGASATVPDVAATARRFLGDGASWVHVSAVGEASERRIEAQIAEAVGMRGVADRVAALFDEAPRRKVLVFTNRRADVETLVAELGRRPRLAGRVFAHHGSLARGERLRVERYFLDAPSAICVATSTLEIGIDIGDVDRVVLLGPPPNVGALLQRVGRGNRKQAVAHVLCLYETPFERARLEHLIACAGVGQLFAEPVAFRPAVAAQQAVSLLFQSPAGWISAAALRERLPSPEREWLTEAACGGLLDGLVEADLLRRVDRGRYVADVEGHRVFERGTLHSNLVDVPELEVVDELTGRALGSVALGHRQREAARAGNDVGMALAGRHRTVARIEEGRLVVRSQPGEDAASFIAKQAPRYSHALARSLAGHLGLAPATFRVHRVSDDCWRLDHFLGTAWGRLLGALLRRRGWRRRPGGGPFRVDLVAAPTANMFGDEVSLRRDLEAATDADLTRLARLYSPGPFSRAVPRELTRAWVIENLKPWKLAEYLAGVDLIEGPLAEPGV